MTTVENDAEISAEIHRGKLVRGRFPPYLFACDEGGPAAPFAAVERLDVFREGFVAIRVILVERVFKPPGPDDATDGEWLTRQIQGKQRLPVRFFMEVGRMEASGIQLSTNRCMRDALVAKGYQVTYRELNGNHDYINWRGGFGDGLVDLLGK